MDECGAMVEFYWQGKTELLEEKLMFSSTFPTISALWMYCPGFEPDSPLRKVAVTRFVFYEPADAWLKFKIESIFYANDVTPTNDV